MRFSLTAEQLEAARAERMRHNGHGAFQIEDVRTWIEETGLCIFLPRSVQAGFTAPTFVEAVAGQRTTEPTLELIATAEQLLVRLEAEGVAVRLNLGGQPGDQPDYVVAGWVLPYVYALRGDRDWRRSPQLTGSRQVSPLAVQVAKHLESGNMTAGQLRDALGREVTESATLRALHELWKQLRVIPVVSEMGQPALWQPLRQRFQKAIAEGASTSQVTAISVLASIYLQAVIAASMEDVEMFLSPLTSRSKIREVVRGLAATRQVHSTPLEQMSMYYVAGTLPDFPAPMSFPGATPSYLSRYQKMLQEEHGGHEESGDGAYRGSRLTISAAGSVSRPVSGAVQKQVAGEPVPVEPFPVEIVPIEPLSAELPDDKSALDVAANFASRSPSRGNRTASRASEAAVRSSKPRMNTAHGAQARPRKTSGGSYSASSHGSSVRAGGDRRHDGTSRPASGRGEGAKPRASNGHGTGSAATGGVRNGSGSRTEHGKQTSANRPAPRAGAARSASGFKKVERETFSRKPGAAGSTRAASGGGEKPAERSGKNMSGNGHTAFRPENGASSRKPARAAGSSKPAQRATGRPAKKVPGTASGSVSGRTANGRTADRRGSESRPSSGRPRAESGGRKSAVKRFSFAAPARQTSAARPGSGKAKTATKPRSR